MTEREQQVLGLIRQNPMISQKSLGEQLGISRESVASHIVNLTRKGYLRGKGYLLNDPLEVMVIGGSTLDIQGLPNQSGLPGDSLPGKVTMTPGGVGRNIAENLARLGHDTRLLSLVGDDEAGAQLLSATEAAGVDISAVRQQTDQRTAVYLSVHDHQRELIQAINDMAIIETLSPEHLTPELAALDHCQTLVVDANLAPETLAFIFTRPQLPTVFADCVSASKALRLKPWLHRIFCLKPNRMEAELLWGQAISSDRDQKNCASWFHHQGVEQLCISLGKEGVFISNAGEQRESPSLADTIVSVGGAGDALMAGLVHSYLKQFNLEQTALTAQACAAIALACHSTVNPALTAELTAKKSKQKKVVV